MRAEFFATDFLGILGDRYEVGVFGGQDGFATMTIAELNQSVNAIVWGVPAMSAIVVVGLWLTVRLRFVQIVRFVTALRLVVGKVFVRQSAGKGAISPFHAVCTALAGTVGTGNIAGVAGAVALGGPGAVFWMWCAALIGMATKFAEVTLAVHFRERGAFGEWVGGPMYMIKNGLGRKWIFLAYIYAIFGVLAVFGTGNSTQVNTICSSIVLVAVDLFSIGPVGIRAINWTLGIVLAGVIASVLLGGIKRIGKVAGGMVPLMALIYFVLAVGILVVRMDAVPAALQAIFDGAFSPKAATGGVVGSVFLCMRRGVSRGIFSNEAGLGTGSIAHACADTDDAVRQGYFGIFEVFVDTIVICTLTALVILVSGVPIVYGQAAGAELTISGFTAVYGSWVSVLTAVAVCFFAFTTVLGWGLYGSRCVEFVFGTGAVRPFFVIYSLVAILGATVDLGVIWDIADTFNGLMMIPNLIALFLLSDKLVDCMRS